MSTPPTKFAIMRANRKKQEQVAAYGRLMETIDLQAMGKMPIQVVPREEYYHAKRNIASYRYYRPEDIS